MEIQVERRGAFSSALVRLATGEHFLSESGAMYRASAGLDIDVTTKTRGKGGFFSGLKRLLASESLFLSRYSAQDGPGEVGLSPTLLGDIKQLDLTSGQPWVLTGGSFLACGPDVALETSWPGLKGLLGGESLFFLRAEGEGPLLVSAFGGLTEQAIDGELIVDTGHLVAYTDGLEVKISKAGKSFFQSFLGGEGLVMRLGGQGRVLTQSHQPPGFGRTLGSLLPPRQQ